MNRLERLYAVSEEIRRRRPSLVSARELADKFGVSRRTMERDLASLRNSGVPLYASPGRSGGQQILGSGAGRHLVSLSAEEITGLLMAVTASSPMPFGTAATAGAERVLDSLPGEVQVSVAELRGRVRVARTGDPMSPTSVRSGQRSRLVVEEAVRLGRVLNLRYANAEGAVTTRSVEAVGFYRGGSDWFLIAWCRLRADRRLFRLDRIRAATMTAELFAARDVDATLGWVPGTTMQPGQTG